MSNNNGYEVNNIRMSSLAFTTLSALSISIKCLYDMMIIENNVGKKFWLKTVIGYMEEFYSVKEKEYINFAKSTHSAIDIRKINGWDKE